MIVDTYTLNTNNLTLNKRGVICKPEQQQVEKNWSLFQSYKDEIQISYGLSGKHIIFRDPTNKPSLFTSCIKAEIESPCTTMFSSIESITKFGDKKVVHFSLSTPAIRFDASSNIAVGHVKLNYNDITNPNFATEKQVDNYIIKKRLYTIIEAADSYVLNNAKYHDKHAIYMYFMFFYKFDLNGNITHVTNFLLPYNYEPYSLVFASGLTMYDQNTVVVSYGVADVQCKLAFFTFDVINKLFVSDIPRANDLTSLHDYLKLVVLTQAHMDTYEAPQDPVPMDTQEILDHMEISHGGKNKKHKNKSTGKVHSQFLKQSKSNKNRA
jgi:hypothetical protein